MFVCDLVIAKPWETWPKVWIQLKKLSSNKLFVSDLHSCILLAFGVCGSNQYILYEGGLKETEAASPT